MRVARSGREVSEREVEFVGRWCVMKRDISAAKDLCKDADSVFEFGKWEAVCSTVWSVFRQDYEFVCEMLF